MSKGQAAATIDVYIASFPEDVQPMLENVRRAIAKAAPGAQEAISYRIPTFRLNGTCLIYFAGFKKHVGVYPVHADSPEFEQALAPYASGKATLRFALDRPIPLDLIAKVVRAKVRKSKESGAGER